MRRQAVAALALVALVAICAAASASAQGSVRSYKAVPTAACLRRDPHYTKYANYNRKPFSIQVFGPAPQLLVYPYERGATMVASYYEPTGPHFGTAVGIYFFDSARSARPFYDNIEAPYLRTDHKPLNLFELRRNTVVLWDASRPTAYRKLILGCLRTA